MIDDTLKISKSPRFQTNKNVESIIEQLILGAKEAKCTPLSLYDIRVVSVSRQLAISNSTLSVPAATHTSLEFDQRRWSRVWCIVATSSAEESKHAA